MPNPLKFLAVPAVVGIMAAPVWAEEKVAEPAPMNIDTVVATVGGTDITLGHVILQAAQLPQNYQSLPDTVLFDAIVDQLIREEAVAQTADEDVSNMARLVLDNQTRSLKAGEALAKLAASAVTDEKVQALYDLRYGNAVPEPEYNASHILLETEEEALDVIKTLEGGADFAELAKEKSTGPSGPNGGQLGWFGKGMMVLPFEEAVVAAEVGAIAGPVETQFGWHVIKVNDTRDLPIPKLDEIRDQLMDEVEQIAIEDAVEDITAETAVTRISAEDIDASAIRNMDLLQN